MDRNLSGYMFRVLEKGEWVNKDITDMSPEQIKSVITENTEKKFLIKLIIGLASIIKALGDKYDLIRASE